MQLSVRRWVPPFGRNLRWKKHKKNSFGTPSSGTHNSLGLPGRICWKVDVASFPMICCMTHFEHQKASKIAFENCVRKQYARENRGGFGGGAAWRIRTPRGREHTSRAPITHRAPRRRARRATPPIKQTLPPSFPMRFDRALGFSEHSLGRK